MWNVLLLFFVAMRLISGEKYPQVLRLRVDILVETNCAEFALKLCNWCLRSPVFHDDLFMRRKQLVLLAQLDHNNFHDEVTCLTQPYLTFDL